MDASTIRTSADLIAYYEEYIATINQLPDASIDDFLAETITRNDIPTVDKKQYSALIKPGCVFKVESVEADVDKAELTAELHIDFSDGREVHETARYHFNSEWQIDQVHSELKWIKGRPD